MISIATLEFFQIQLVAVSKKNPVARARGLAYFSQEQGDRAIFDRDIVQKARVSMDSHFTLFTPLMGQPEARVVPPLCGRMEIARLQVTTIFEAADVFNLGSVEDGC